MNPFTATLMSNLAVPLRARASMTPQNGCINERRKYVSVGIHAPVNNLVGLHKSQGKYGSGDPGGGVDLMYPYTASVNNLADFYKSQSKYNDAEPSYKQALVICNLR